MTPTQAKPAAVLPRGEGRKPREATGINIDQRRPIDPRMPNAAPA